ncbi:MAG: hypothetical protein HWD61_14215 [Parachlamydiaceae bacterium]|nr:MAG: hypothetical protein HWD61_14215 [Parachlamydiaceae bacterium]
MPGDRIEAINSNNQKFRGTVLGIDENKRLLVHDDASELSVSVKDWNILLSKNKYWIESYQEQNPSKKFY